MDTPDKSYGMDELVPTIKDEYSSLETLNRNRNYTQLLDMYINHVKINIWTKFGFKIIFFISTMIILGLIVFLFYKSLNFVLFNLNKFDELSNITIEAILGMLTAVVPSVISLIVAFIEIPKIIAQYLFNTNEDHFMDSVIRNTQNFDKEIVSMQRKAKEIIKQKRTPNTEIAIKEDDDNAIEESSKKVFYDMKKILL